MDERSEKIKGSKVIYTGLLIAALIAFLGCVTLFILSFLSFTHTGPPIPQNILDSYSSYLVLSMLRLGAWAWLLQFLMAYAGILIYQSLACACRWRMTYWVIFIAGVSGGVVLTSLQFIRHLLYIPSSIVASFNYRVDRLNILWEWLSPTLIGAIDIIIGAVFIGSIIFTFASIRAKSKPLAYWFSIVGGAYVVAIFVVTFSSEPPLAKVSGTFQRPNILMIGSDTLRADRLGVNGYHRKLTPHIDALAKKGVNFTNFYVPIARTGPSMVSLLTSTYPPRNGIRRNFVGDTQKNLSLQTLPKELQKQGYVTAAVADWAGGDLGKFNFGFEYLSVAPDQWNLKMLLRQGPKDIRLFLTLFTHNRFGKIFLPELYYLAGVPLTRQKGLEARQLMHKFSLQKKPFFLNFFVATTHAPFGSDYPYYMVYTDPAYKGSSKFVISGLTDIKGIIKRQGQSAAHFDIQQINNLYDGAVKSFDDEVGRLISYLSDSGLSKNTIVIIYSDHGTDLWENGLWGQGNSLSEYNHKIPLVIVGPGVSEGISLSMTIPSIDLAPTLLDMIGADPASSFDGQSLKAAINNATVTKDRLVYAETGLSLGRIPQEKSGKPLTIIDALHIPNHDSSTMEIRPEFRRTLIHTKKRMTRRGSEYYIYDPLKLDKISASRASKQKSWLKEKMQHFLKQDGISQNNDIRGLN